MSTILDLAIAVSLVDGVSHVIKNVIGQFGLLENASDSAKKKLEGYKNMAFVGAGIAAAGAVGVAALTHLAEKAADVEQQLIQLGGVYGINIDDTQMKDIEDRAQALSQKTLFSKKEVLGINVELAHAGISKEALEKIVPEATYLAEVEMGIGKSGSAHQTAYNFARMAEDAGITNDTERMTKFADDMNRVINVTHANTQSIGEGFKYSMPVVKNLGWTEYDNLLATAMEARAGVEGTMAGTHIKDFAERINPFKYLDTRGGQKQLDAMNQMDLLSGVQYKKGKAGKMEIVGFESAALLKDKDHLKSYADMVDVLSEKYQAFLKKGGGGQEYLAEMTEEQLNKMQSKAQAMTGQKLSGGALQWAAMANHLWGEQGQDFAIISSHKEVFDKLQGQLKAQKSLHEQIEVIRNSFKGQMHVLDSNIETLGLQVGAPLMKAATLIIKAVADAFGHLIETLSNHPQAVKFLSVFAGGVSLFLLVAGAIIIAYSAIGMLNVAMSAAGITWTMVASRALLAMGVFGLVAGIAYLVYKNWDQVKILWIEYGFIVRDLAIILLVAYAPAIIVASANMVQLAAVTGYTMVRTLLLNAATGVSAIIMGGYRSIMLVATAAQWLYNIAMGNTIATTTLQYAALILLGPVIMAIRLATLAWTGVQWLINAALTANPIGIVIVLVGALIIGVIAMTVKWHALWDTLKGFAQGMPGWASVLLAVFVPVIGIPLLLLKYWDKVVAKVKEFFGLKGKQPEVPEAAKVAAENPVKIPTTLDMGKIDEQLKALNANGMGNVADLKIPAGIDMANIDKQMADMQAKMGQGGSLASLELANGLASPEGTAKIAGSTAAISTTITDGLPKPEAAYQHGQNLGQSLADGMTSKEDQVRQAAKLLATAVHDNLGVNSPTKEGPLSTNHLWGGNLVRSIASGMLNNLQVIKNASFKSAEAMTVTGQGGSEPGLRDRVSPPGRGGMVVQGPLIGAIYQQPGENSEAFIDRLIYRLKTELGFDAEQANLTMGRLSFQGVG